MHMRKQWCAGSYTDLMVNQSSLKPHPKKCLSASTFVRHPRRDSEGPILELYVKMHLPSAFARHTMKTARSVNETGICRDGRGSPHSSHVGVVGAGAHAS